MHQYLIGVAGWDYPDWIGIVYPAAGSTDRLAWIARFVDAVEINATFYRPNRPSTAEMWVRRTAFRNRFRGKALANALQMRHVLTGEKPEAPAELVDEYPALAPDCRPIRERLF